MLDPNKCQMVIEVRNGTVKMQCPQPIECYICQYCHHHCLTHFDLREHLVYETAIVPEHMKKGYERWKSLHQQNSES